jgi:hypothetical protein
MNYLLSYKLYIAPVGEVLEHPSRLVGSNLVMGVDINHDAAMDLTSGIALGMSGYPSATVTLKKTSFNSFSLRTFNWRLANIIVYYSLDGVNYSPSFAGFIETRSEQLNEVSFTCYGYLKLLEYYRHYTPLWKNKPVATPIPEIPLAAKPWSTSVSGIWGQYIQNQDPTTLSGFYTGTINTLFWLMGGRPYQYKDHFVNTGQNARFWYDADPCPIVPKFTWMNLEEVSQDVSLLAGAAGAQITQTTDGVVRVLSPHSFSSAPKNITITDSMFTTIDIEEESAVTFGKAIVTFTPRFLGANKAVLDDPIGVYLAYNEEYEHEIELPQPVDRLTNNTYYGSGVTYGISGGLFGIGEYISSFDFVRAVDYNGDTSAVLLKVPKLTNLYYARDKFNWNTQTNTGYWSKVQDYAKTPGQFMKLVVKNNNSAKSLYLAKISLFGVPVESGEPQTVKKDIDLDFTGLVTSGIVPSGFREVALKDNPYVQSKDHAMRLLDVIRYLYKKPRPVIRIVDMVYNPNIQVGDIITIRSTFYNLDGQFKVTGISIKDTGSKLDINCIDVSDIKTKNQFFIIGSGYVGNTEKYLSW